MSSEEEKAQVNVETNALNLSWSFGFNSTLPGGVINLTDSERSAIFYVSANTGLIQDLVTGKQHLLQGHCNPIRSVAASSDNRLVVTADAGPDSMVVVWDSLTAAPLATLIEPHPNGIAALDITPDSAFIITLSNDYPQTIAVWDWASGRKEPVASAQLGTDVEFLHFVRFNPADVRDIITNGQKQVVFWVWTGNEIKPFFPSRKGLEKLKKSFGSMTQSTFIPYSSRVVTATTSGEVVLWDYATADPNSPDATGREAVKIVRLATVGGINYLSTIGAYLVSGGSDGAVRFFDVQFRIVSWLEDLQAGEVTALSFAKQPLEPPAVATSPLDFLSGFKVPDFLVATMSGKVLHVDSRVLADSNPERRRGQLLLNGFDSDVTSLDSHPSLPLFLLGLASGHLQLWDYQDKLLLAQLRVPPPPSTMLLPFSTSGSGGGDAMEAARAKEAKEAKEAVHVRQLRIAPDGSVAAVGFQNGAIRIYTLHGSPQYGLVEQAHFRNSHTAILDIAFSLDSQYVATADSDRCVSLYRFHHRDEDPNKPKEWMFIGRNRAHAKKITNLYFGSLPAALDPHYQFQQRLEKQKLMAERLHSHHRSASMAAQQQLLQLQSRRDDFDVPVLLSVGEDRMLHRYDVAGASLFNGLKVISSTKVEQSASPLGVWLDPAPLSSLVESSNPVDLVALHSASPGLGGLPGGLSLAGHGSTQTLSNYVVVANSEFKFKLWQYDASMIQEIEPPPQSQQATNGDTDAANGSGTGVDDNVALPQMPTLPTILPAQLRCVRTALGPTFGTPVRRLLVVPEDPQAQLQRQRNNRSRASPQPSTAVENEGRAHKFLAYSTGNKVVGLLKLGLDGNPHKSMGVIAHPGAVSAMAVSHDGRFMITAGGADRSVNLWTMDVHALDAAASLAPPESESYASLIEGGREGPFFDQIVDYFYYCQLRAQGEDTPEPRKITGTIHLDEAVALMRGLGFYPSQQQIQDLCDEVEHTQPSNSLIINFEKFIKLYVNHRPVFQVGKDEIRDAFRILAGDTGTMTRDVLLTKLQSTGEKMSEKELIVCLQALLGDGSFLETIPRNVTADNFAMDLLGFEDYERDESATATAATATTYAS